MSSTNFTAKHTADSIKLFSISANIENAKSYIMQPANMRCQRMSDAEQVVKGINKDLIRLSGRVEDRKDLKVFAELQA
ncbi:MAG TPA: PLP-dependent transferase [Flavobacterium sp.]|uniref:PLP-dependent transferase n=1 Tax=Flavobacterium sp. TaxID=239 RepID=UPI002DBF85C3|nr:PLP-dependent transferase [Flavobacterium sp.]HEU4790264.1 PLP-dependent transferase [Flavobacterium sp.]